MRCLWVRRKERGREGRKGEKRGGGRKEEREGEKKKFIAMHLGELIANDLSAMYF